MPRPVPSSRASSWGWSVVGDLEFFCFQCSMFSVRFKVWTPTPRTFVSARVRCVSPGGPLLHPGCSRGTVHRQRGHSFIICSRPRRPRQPRHLKRKKTPRTSPSSTSFQYRHTKIRSRNPSSYETTRHLRHGPPLDGAQDGLARRRQLQLGRRRDLTAPRKLSRTLSQSSRRPLGQRQRLDMVRQSRTKRSQRRRDGGATGGA